MVFGTNTDSSRTLGRAGQPVAEEARAYFLGSRGFAVDDLADLRAILAIEAIERGIIVLRVYDPDLAQPLVGRRPPMLHAKLVVGHDHALSGSSNFSNGGLRRNLEFMDDAVGTPDLAIARREAAEQFWLMVNAGQCQPVSGCKIREIKGLSDKPLLSLSYWNR